MNIGKAMKQIREENHLSRKEMAEKIGCTVASLWKVESGKVTPKKETINRFCEAVSIPLVYLYTRSFEKLDYYAPLPM